MILPHGPYDLPRNCAGIVTAVRTSNRPVIPPSAMIDWTHNITAWVNFNSWFMKT